MEEVERRGKPRRAAQVGKYLDRTYLMRDRIDPATGKPPVPKRAA